jgi:cytidine deaminase
MSMTSEAADGLDPEDAKLVILARSARTRTRAAEGAAVRDDIGRTYAAATVDLTALQLTALQAAVAAAVSSGSTTIEAACVVRDSDGAAPALGEADQRLLDDLRVGSVLLAAADGTLLAPPRAAG